MKIEFDPAKDTKNQEKHGLSLAAAAEFDFETSLVWVDDRKDYHEVRYTGLGYIRSRLHAVVFTLRDDTFRIISLRKANAQERKKYETQKP